MGSGPDRPPPRAGARAPRSPPGFVHRHRPAQDRTDGAERAHPRRPGGRRARAAGRSLSDVDVWWFAKTNLADTRAAAIDHIKMALAASANHAFRFTLEGKGVAPELHEPIRALQRAYDSHHHEIAGAGNAGLTDRFGLTEFLVDRFAIAGTPADCVNIACICS